MLKTFQVPGYAVNKCGNTVSLLQRSSPWYTTDKAGGSRANHRTGLSASLFIQRNYRRIQHG